MKQYFLVVIALWGFTIHTTQAQTSGPRKPPTVSRSTSTESPTRSSEASTPKSEGNLVTRNVNGLSITLKRVKGNAADQTVTLDLLIINPKGNARVVISSAYAVDPEGDKHEDVRGYSFGSASMEEVLYTDVPRKASISVRGVPDKIKSLILFKFVVYNQLSNQNIDIEYRNLPIEW